MNAIAERLQNGKVEAWKTWVTGERLIRWNEMMKRCKKACIQPGRPSYVDGRIER